jgi:uncharacterized protein DUF3106
MRVRPLFGLMALAAALGSVFPLEAQGNRKQLRQLKQPLGIPARDLERFAKMSPEERREQLAKLPPERRQQLERRLERYQNLPPEQREQLQRRYEAFQSLPPPRQLAVRGELLNLRRMSPAERRARLDSPEVRQYFSPEEQRLLRAAMGQGDAP